MELSILGVRAVLDPPNPVVPKGIAAAVRVYLEAGNGRLDPVHAAAFLGPGFRIEAELSGPGLQETVALPDLRDGAELPADPFVLPIPPLLTGGSYALSNLRIVLPGGRIMDVEPRNATLEVIDQILVTSVKTQALTLDQIRAKGIVLDSDAYTGFEFTLGLVLSSKPINFSFPVVFDAQGVAIPLPNQPPSAPVAATPGAELPPLPTIVPLLLDTFNGAGEKIKITLPAGAGTVRVPSVLVIPGNVGYLKQFFSAQLFVANGASVVSGLKLDRVTGKVHLPLGEDHTGPNADDPLGLPTITRDGVTFVQPVTMDVRHVGPDGVPGTADDESDLAPGEQGQAEFLLRGDREGFHNLHFDISARLIGGAIPPNTTVKGTASGGVLVRNAFFNMAFTVPSVVRKDEVFPLYVTVTNISQSPANLVRLELAQGQLSGATVMPNQPKPGVPIEPPGVQTIPTLLPGESELVRFDFKSQKTGQVVASYLKLHVDPQSTGGSNGALAFSLGVGERGVPLSPDTLVLPAVLGGPDGKKVPDTVVDAAMRVLGQAWSVANAPTGTLPADVKRTSKTVVTQKALALAEAALRIALDQPVDDAVRDIAYDFYGGAPIDPGFDQLLRSTDAGRSLALALGQALTGAVDDAGGMLAYEAAAAEVAAAGADFLSLSTRSTHPVVTTIRDARGRLLANGPSAASLIPGGVLLPLGEGSESRGLGLVLAPNASPYTIVLTSTASDSVDLGVTVPRGDGTYVRAEGTGLQTDAGGTVKLVVDLSRPEDLEVVLDLAIRGALPEARDMSLSSISSAGPNLVAAAVIGPRTVAGASPFGFQSVLVFDRVVSAASAARTENYELANNSVRAARQQLSGRLVFASLSQPEGPYVPASIEVRDIADTRGNVRPGNQDAMLLSLLEDPGAIVTGTVRDADGQPVPTGTVVYANQPDLSCLNPTIAGFSSMPLSADGRFDVHYVRQDQCGSPFQMITQDPVTGARREVSARVAVGGETLVMDIILRGRGGVRGVVTNSSGQPVGGAMVAALSTVDGQSGGFTTTDGDGAYTITGVSVGPINVTAGKNGLVASAAGRIYQPGTDAVVDLSLRTAGLTVKGRVDKLEKGPGGTDVLTPLAGQVVVYYLRAVPVALANTETDGTYVFTNVPRGPFSVGAELNSRDRARVERSEPASTVTVVEGVDLVIAIPEPAAVGSVSGVVTMPDGQTPVGDVVVSVGDRGVVTGNDGLFEIPGVKVQPGPQLVTARSRDGKRSGTTSVTVSEPGAHPGRKIVLSSVGNVEFFVQDPTGQPVNDATVRLLGFGCSDPCGCAARTPTDGSVGYTALPQGPITAKAIRGTDVISGTATITDEGSTAVAVLRFRGTGIVRGTVTPPPNTDMTGALVTLRSRQFTNDGVSVCDLIDKTTEQATTGPYAFANVHAGPVTVAASHPFLPTPVSRSGSVTHGSTAVLDLTLVDTMAGVLSGTVFAPGADTPVGAGVEVSVTGALSAAVKVRTDGQGRFAFARVFPQGYQTLTVIDDSGRGVAQMAIFLSKGQDLDQPVHLKGRGTVVVKVVDGAGEPARSSFVKITHAGFPQGTFDAATDDAGRVQFEGMYEGVFAVEAWDVFRRGGRGSVTLPASGVTAETTVALTVTGEVRGRFLLPGGVAVPYGTVRLTAAGRTIGQMTTSGAGDVGSFRFDYVPAGDLRLDAEDPRTGRTGYAAGRLTSQAQVVALDVTAQALGTVSGLITSNAAPAPNANVTISSGSYVVNTSAGSDGRYSVDGIPEGPITVTAALDNGFLRGTRAATLAGEGSTVTIDVPLRNSVEVRGRVLDASGTSGRLAAVTIAVGGIGGAQQTGVTDADGRFHFSTVPEGTAALTAAALNGIDRGHTVVEVLSGVPEPAAVEVKLRGVGTIEGTTEPGGTITVSAPGEFGYNHWTVAASDGTFRFPQVLAGPFTATVRIGTGATLRAGTVTDVLEPGATKSIAIAIEPSGSLTGRVVRADGANAYGSTVALDLVGRGSASAVVGLDGGFLFEGVTAGNFRLVATDPLTSGRAHAAGTVVVNTTTHVGTLVVDALPPAVTFVAPVQDETRAAFQMPWIVDVVDTGSQLDPGSLRISYNGGYSTAVLATIEGNRARGVLRHDLMKVGENEIEISAADAVGNRGLARVRFHVTGGTVTVAVRRGGAVLTAPVSVTVNRVAHETTPAGTLTLTGQLPGSYAASVTDLLSRVLVQGSETLPDGEAVTITLTLPSVGAIVGRVRRGPVDEPVVGATVVAGSQTTTTGADGAFRLENLPHGTYTVAATHDASGDRGRFVGAVVQDGATPVTLLMNGVGSATVTVRDSGGNLVSGADIVLSTSSILGGTYTRTSLAGPVTIERVLAGTLTATANHAATGRFGEATAPLADRGTASLVIVLSETGTVKGSVRRRSGVVADGIALTLNGSSFGTTVSHADGSFELGNVKPGAFTLSALDPVTGDRASASGTLARVPGTTGPIVVTADLTLNGVGTVVATVTRASGTPAVGASVVITSALGGPWTGAATDEQGRSPVANVLAGPITVTAAMPGGASVTKSADLTHDTTLDVALTLPDLGRVEGRVYEPDGVTPAVGASVQLTTRAAQTVDASGAFTFGELPLRSYTLMATVGGRMRASATVAVATPGATMTQDLILSGIGTVQGVLSLPSGEPAPAGVVVEALATGAFGSPVGAYTAAGGAFVLEGVAVGRFTLSATHAGGRAEGAGFVAQHGAVETVNLRLVASAVNLPIELRDGNNVSFRIASDGTSRGASASETGPSLTLVRDGVPTPFEPASSIGSYEDGQREVAVSQSGLAGLNITRKVFVPSNGYFVRHLELLHNPGTEPVTVDVVTRLSSAKQLSVIASGGTGAQAGDAWLTLDEDGAGSFVPLGVVNADPVAGLAPAEVTLSLSAAGSALQTRFADVTVAPGQTAAILWALTVQGDRDRARASAQRLASLPPELIAGLSPAEAQAVRNFVVPGDQTSPVPPLPATDGLVHARAFSGDGVTPARVPWVTGGISASYQSRSPHYYRPWAVSLMYFSDFTGSFDLRSAPAHFSGPQLVPRDAFDLSFTYEDALGAPVIATATHDFPSTGVVNLATMPGAIATASSVLTHAHRDPAHAFDADVSTVWGSAINDAKSPPYTGTPWVQLSFPAPVAVSEVRVRGLRDENTHGRIRQVKIEMRDGAGLLLRTLDADLVAPFFDGDVPLESTVEGVRTLRVWSLADSGSSVGLADVEVIGTGTVGAVGEADARVVFHGLGAIAGRVTRQDGRPVTGAVQLRQGAGSIQTSLDAQGSYLFALVRPGSYALTATVTGGASLSSDVTVVADTRQMRDFEFPYLGRITGSLRTAAGTTRPWHAVHLSGNGVEIYDWVDPNGEFAFDNLLVGEYQIQVSSYSFYYPSLARGVSVRAGVDPRIDLVLPPIGSVKATVTDGGQPVDGAVVEWRSPSRGPDWLWGGETDATGTVVVEEVTGPTFEVRAWTRAVPSVTGVASGAIDIDGQQVAVAIVIPAGSTVTGQVRSRTGAVRGGGVRLFPEDAGSSILGTTDGSGFTVTNVPTGPFRLRTTEYPAEVTGEVPGPGSTVVLDALAAGGAVTAAGQVDYWSFDLTTQTTLNVWRSIDGSVPPLASIAVRVLSPTGAAVASATGTGNRVSALLPVPAPGTYYVGVSAADGVSSGGYGVTVSASRPARIFDGTFLHGRLLRENGGDGISGETIDLVRGGLAGARAVSAGDGRFSLPLIGGAGSLTLVVSAGDGRPRARRELTWDGVSGLEDVTIVLPDRGTVAVRLAGRYLAPQPVTIETTHPLAVGDGTSSLVVSGTSTLQDVMVPVGTVTARTADPLGGPDVTASATLVEGGREELVLTLPAAPGLRGVVLDEGLGVAALVTLVGVGGEVLQSTTTSASEVGSFSFADVAPGRYVVRAFHAATQRPGEVVVDVSGTAETLVVVNLLPVSATGIIDLHAVLESTEPAANQTVTVSNPDLPSWQVVATTDANGHAHLTELPPGRFVLTTLPDAGWEDGVVVAGRTVNVQLVLGRNAPFMIDLSSWFGVWSARGQGDIETTERARDGVTPGSAPPLCKPWCGTYASANGQTFAARAMGRLDETGRQVEVGPRMLAGLEVRRRVFVPLEGDFARTIDVIHNPTSESITVDYALDHRLTDVAYWDRWTSSEDQELDGADDFLALLNPGYLPDGGWDDRPSVGLIFAGTGSTIRPTVTGNLSQLGDTTIRAVWPGLTVPAGESRIVASFALQWYSAGWYYIPESLAAVAKGGLGAFEGLSASELEQVVNFPPPARLQGHFQDDDGLGLPDALVVIENLTVGSGYEQRTAADGSFEFVGVEPGDYRITATDRAVRFATTSATVEPAAVTTVVLRLPTAAETGSLRVRSRVAFTNAPSSGSVRLTQPGGWSGSTTLDSQGEALFERLPPGPYVLALNADAVETASWEDVVAGQIVYVDRFSGTGGEVPIDLTGSDGLGYHVNGDGVVRGSYDSWDCVPFCMAQAVLAFPSGWEGYSGWRWPLVDDSRREVLLPGYAALDTLFVSRRLFVPAEGGFLRIVDVYENRGPEPIAVDLRQELPLDPATGWALSGSSSGDLSFDASDHYAFVSAPTAAVELAWITHGTGGSRAPDVSGPSHDPEAASVAALQATYTELTIPAGGRVLLLTFAVQRGQGDFEGLLQQVVQLAAVTDPRALDGLTEEDRAAIVNFDAVDPEGAATTVFGPRAIPADDGLARQAHKAPMAQSPVTPGLGRKRKGKRKVRVVTL